MKLQLPNNICSPQDLAALTLEVQNYARWFSQASIKLKTHAGSALEPPELTPAATELIQSLSPPVTLKSLDELIDSLQKFKQTASSLTITLAAPAPGDLKQTIVAWCRKNIATDVLVTFKFNATILGGMVVSYGSHIFDWSFRRQILAARSKFPEILRRV
jgi:hypothetical protein